MTLIAFALSLLITVLGAVTIVDPTVLLTISRPFLTPAGLYAVGGLRLVLGTALFLAAPTSRAPKTLRIVGVVIVVAGVVTPLLGVDRARAIVEWWTGNGTAFMRAWGGVAFAFGAFLVYATARRTPRSEQR